MLTAQLTLVARMLTRMASATSSDRLIGVLFVLRCPDGKWLRLQCQATKCHSFNGALRNNSYLSKSHELIPALARPFYIFRPLSLFHFLLQKFDLESPMGRIKPGIPDRPQSIDPERDGPSGIGTVRHVSYSRRPEKWLGFQVHTCWIWRRFFPFASLNCKGGEVEAVTSPRRSHPVQLPEANLRGGAA